MKNENPTTSSSNKFFVLSINDGPLFPEDGKSRFQLHIENAKDGNKKYRYQLIDTTSNKSLLDGYSDDKEDKGFLITTTKGDALFDKAQEQNLRSYALVYIVLIENINNSNVSTLNEDAVLQEFDKHNLPRNEYQESIDKLIQERAIRKTDEPNTYLMSYEFFIRPKVVDKTQAQ